MEKGYKQLTDEAREVILAAIQKLERAYWMAPDDQARDRIERQIDQLRKLVISVR